MWANAQRDGRPTEYRWRPLFNAAKFGCPLLEYRAVTLPRRETRWNLLGCPKLANSSQPLLGQSSPYWVWKWCKMFTKTELFLIKLLQITNRMLYLPYSVVASISNDPE